MDVASLAFRTDLALLEQAGSTIEDCGDHLVVRTADNPLFYWGNFLLLQQIPGSDGVDHWLERFEAAIPAARHRAFGFGAAHAAAPDLSGFADRGLEIEASTVMTATSVHAPANSNLEAGYRPLQSDDDWTQSVELELACDDSDEPAAHRREFVARRAESNRALVAAGHGQWFGAFVRDALVAQLGLITAGVGLARFQSVETHPDHRGRGLAGTLLHHAGCYGFRELGATTLVIVADPDYHAIRLYRRIGFSDTESQLQALRKPAQDAG